MGVGSVHEIEWLRHVCVSKIFSQLLDYNSRHDVRSRRRRLSNPLSLQKT